MLGNFYDRAQINGQNNIEAILISSYSHESNEVDSRFVNLKYIDNDKFIFFSNYQSPKSNQFMSHNQISAVLFWDSINIQIRIKALIEKTSKEFNQIYFSKRDKKKNALAISSNQSININSYSEVKKEFNETLLKQDLSVCPDYWGGYSFNPYYFEFWEGHESRLNKRDIYEIRNGKWHHSILQP